MGHGGARPGAGRKKGSKHLLTADLKAACREHMPVIIAELVNIATKGETHAARVAAIKELLDRGYGKAVQPVDGDGEGGPIKFTQIRRVIVDPSN